MSRIGKYELLSLLGRGGMGEVWRARDEELGRIVAIKLVQRTGPEDLARFRREAQFAARLSHPNIAQLFEFHEDPTYIAMQFIEGASIGEGPHDRIAALRDAARAVHYAHGQGIVHRDVKPANILVDAGGRAFVLDFGLARGVRGDVTAMSVTGDVLGTPSYMAPEQARGEVNALDARTDVYGLGATLYYLIAGRPPHAGPSTYEVLRRVIEEDPLPSGGAWELQTVAAKALEKEPARRYASAEEFADELDRYLKHEPIRARPASAFYRLRKRIRREPVLWGLGALLAGSLAAGVTISLVALSRALESERRERGIMAWSESAERAGRRLRELEAEMARKMDDNGLKRRRSALGALEGEVAAASALHGEAAAGWLLRGQVRLLLHCEAAAIEAFTAALNAPATEWSSRMGVKGLAAYGRARARLCLFQDLTDHSSEADKRRNARRAAEMAPVIAADLALAGRSGLPEEMGRAAGLWLAFIERRVDDVGRGCDEEIRRGGRTEEFYFLRGLVAGTDPGFLTESIARNAYQPRVLFHRALIHRDNGEIDKAAADFREAIRLKPDYADAMDALGTILQESGDLEGALAEYSRAIAASPGHSQSYGNRGKARMDAGDVKGGLADLDRAVELDDQNAVALYDRGNHFLRSGDPARAIADYDRALAADPDLGPAYNNRGNARKALGEFAAALKDYEAAIQREPGDAVVRNGRAALLFMLDRVPEALEEYARAIQADPNYALAYANRSEALRESGDLEGSLNDATKAVELDDGLGEAHLMLGRILTKLRRLEEAAAEMDRAVALGPDAARVRFSRGVVRGLLGDAAGAIEDYDRSIDMDPREANAFFNRGLLHGDRGEFPQALADFERAATIQPENLEFLFFRAQAKIDTGDARGALRDFEALVKRGPDHPRAETARVFIDQIRRAHPDDY